MPYAMILHDPALDAIQALVTERNSLRAEVATLRRDVARGKAEMRYVIEECAALIRAWRDDWSGSEFDGRDTQRLFDGLRAWLESGRVAEPTECRDWYDRLYQ